MAIPHDGPERSREIRAVVTDLDGTVVRSDGTISPESIRAASSLQHKQIPLLVATARTPPVRILGDLRPHVALAICNNGSVGYRPSDDQQLWRVDLSPNAVQQVITTARQKIPEVGYGVRDGRCWVVNPGFARANGRWPTAEHTVGEDAEIIATPTNMMSVRHRELDASQIGEILAANGITPDVATICPGGPTLLDLAPAGVDKGSGLRRALGLLGIDPADVVAFGDADNDLPLFAAVGHAIAMQNAWPSVIHAADAVTTSVDEDGFARCLDRLGVLS